MGVPNLSGRNNMLFNMTIIVYFLALIFFSNIIITPVKAEVTLPAFSEGGSHTLALNGNGTNWALSRINDGQLGDGTITSKTVRVKATFKPVKLVLTSDQVFQSLIIKKDETLFTNGYSLRVLGNLTIEAGGVLDASNYSNTPSVITVSGNWINYGTYIAGKSRVVFYGDGVIKSGGAELGAFYEIDLQGGVRKVIEDDLKTTQPLLVPFGSTLVIDTDGFDLIAESGLVIDGEVIMRVISSSQGAQFILGAGSTTRLGSNGKLTLIGNPAFILRITSSEFMKYCYFSISSDATFNIIYCGVRDCNAELGETIHASDSIDLGNNVNWKFGPYEYTLSLTKSGQGTITKSPDKSIYLYGDVVQLTATPEAYWLFSEWSGDATGTSNPLSITMDENKTVIATFILVGNLRITVRDNNGNPLSGATISSIYQPAGQMVLSGITSSDGTFLFNGVVPGSYGIKAFKSGYVAGLITVNVAGGGTNEALLSLQSMTAIRVVVKDSDSSNPLSGVAVISTSQPVGQPVLNGSTNTTGLVEFKGLGSGSFTLQASKLGYTSTSTSVMADLGVTKEITINLKITPIDLRIIVKDNTGKLLSGVRVNALTRPQGQGSLTLNTDLNGIAFFPGIKPGNYVFQLSKTRYMTSSLPLEIAPGLQHEVSATLLSSSSAFFGLEDDEETYQKVAIVLVGLLVGVGAWFIWHRRHP